MAAAFELLALPVGSQAGGLTVATRNYPAGTSTASVTSGTAYAESVVLTADGRTVGSAWCTSDCAPAGQWVQYERWTLGGRRAHGFACPVCRNIAQTG